VSFLEEGVGEFVFALAVLLGEDALGVFEVDIGAGLDRDFVREDGAKDRIDHELGVAAGASDVQIVRFAFSHNGILRQLNPESD
jgi:hypothetical protein